MRGPTHNPINRLAALALAAIAATALLASQGCCPQHCRQWCDKQIEAARTPVASSFVFRTECRLVGGELKCDEVCSQPYKLNGVKRGQPVTFKNQSPYAITLTSGKPNPFVEEGPVFVEAGSEVKRQVSKDVPLQEYSFEMTVAAPGDLCPGYPGPVMDVDG